MRRASRTAFASPTRWRWTAPRGSRPAALRDRGRLQPGSAQHADGRFHRARDVGQLRHRATRWASSTAWTSSIRAWCARWTWPASTARWTWARWCCCRRSVFAHRRGLQPDHGRGRHQRGHRPAGRQADVRDRDRRHPRAPRTARVRRQPDRHRTALADAEKLLAALPRPSSPPTPRSTCSTA